MFLRRHAPNTANSAVYDGTISDSVIAERWNLNAPDRLRDLSGKLDPKYFLLLEHLETVLELHGPTQHPTTRAALDVGCGLGFATNALRQWGYSTAGIDISHASIQLAKQSFGGRFAVSDATTYVHDMGCQNLDLVTLTMVLHCVRDIHPVLRACATLLKSDGLVCVSIPHPNRYLQHKPYFDEMPFDYFVERVFDIPFRVSTSRPHRSRVLFFHRPLSAYFRAFTDAGLSVDAYLEPALNESSPLADVVTFVLRRTPL